jgi:hypothetical protein
MGCIDNARRHVKLLGRRKRADKFLGPTRTPVLGITCRNRYPQENILSVLLVDHFDQVQLSRHCPTRICLLPTNCNLSQNHNDLI